MPVGVCLQRCVAMSNTIQRNAGLFTARIIRFLRLIPKKNVEYQVWIDFIIIRKAFMGLKMQSRRSWKTIMKTIKMGKFIAKKKNQSHKFSSTCVTSKILKMFII